MNQKHDGSKGSQATKTIFPENLEYEIFEKDKFILRLPKNPGFFFDEYGCWTYLNGNKAWIGVTDVVRQSLNDIMFFIPPTVGAEIIQFGELGAIESAKAVFSLASPVTGKVTAINEALTADIELMNQNPYEKGWIAEMELADFENDRKALMDFSGYLPVFKRKMDEFQSK